MFNYLGLLNQFKSPSLLFMIFLFFSLLLLLLIIKYVLVLNAAKYGLMMKTRQKDDFSNLRETKYEYRNFYQAAHLLQEACVGTYILQKFHFWTNFERYYSMKSKFAERDKPVSTSVSSLRKERNIFKNNYQWLYNFNLVDRFIHLMVSISSMVIRSEWVSSYLFANQMYMKMKMKMKKKKIKET